MHSHKHRQACALAIAALLALCAGAPCAAQPDDEIQALFEQGLAALDADQLKTAREAFEEVLRRNPNLHRARLELALTHYRALNYGEARRQAQLVLDEPTAPPDVRATVQAFVAQIDEEQEEFAIRHVWTPTLDTSLLYDSNVNVGPISEIFFFSGTLIELDPTSGGRSDSAVAVRPGIAHIFRPGTRIAVGERSAYLQWQSDAGFYHRQYFEETDFNLSVLSVGTGPALIALRHWRADLRAQADYLLLGGDDLALFGSLLPSVSWELPGGFGLVVDGIFTAREYTNSVDEPRDGLFTSAGIALGHQFSERRLSAQAGIRYNDLDADTDRFSYYGPEFYGGANFGAWPNGTISLRVALRALEFRGAEPAPFGVPRDDDELRYLVGFEHAFPRGTVGSWILRGGWIRTDNDSDVPIYEYERDVFSIGMWSAF